MKFNIMKVGYKCKLSFTVDKADITNKNHVHINNILMNSTKFYNAENSVRADGPAE